MDSMPRITRVILYANSRYNYLTVNDNGKAKLHYVKPLKVFKNGALWFDNVKNMVCVIDGVKGSCVNGFEYRVLYFDTLSENYLTTNDLDETSITTEYANKNLTIPTFLKFLKIGEMWVDGDGDVFKIEYLHKTNDGGITHVGVDNKKVITSY